MTTWLTDSNTPLEELWSRWLSEINTEVDESTLDLFELHGTAHIVPFFRTLGALTTAAFATYARARLGKVKRVTVKKEQSTLRRFLTWCGEQGYAEDLPIVPPLPRRAPGTPFHLRRRGRATDLSVEEVRRSSIAFRSGRHHEIRSLFQFVPASSSSSKRPCAPQRSTRSAFPSTTNPEPRSSTDEIDKARAGREVPLSKEACEALDAIAPKRGLLFGSHDYRDVLRKAATGVLPTHKANTFTAYDLRHARLTQLAESGNLTGAAYLAGHKRVSTTALYVRTNRSAAERVLAAVGPTGFAPPRAKTR